MCKMMSFDLIYVYSPETVHKVSQDEFNLNLRTVRLFAIANSYRNTISLQNKYVLSK